MNNEIIITFSLYGIGGAQRRAFALANRFADKGYTVYVVAVWGRDSTIGSENYYGVSEKINLVIVPEYYDSKKNDKKTVQIDKYIDSKIFVLKKLQLICQGNKKLLNKINYSINGYKKSKDLRPFLVEHPNATVISFGFNIFDKVFFAVKGLQNRLIYAETNASDKYVSERYYNNIKQSIKKSSACVFQTKEEQKDHDMQGCTNSYVIHNPVKADLPEPYSGERKKVIVNFCRMTRQKNLLLLIQAFEKFLRVFPDYKLEIYADTAAENIRGYKDELIKYITDNDLSESVYILPASSKIHDIIRDYAMFVSSSDYEGISNSMVEAMAIGLPCVCTDCGGGGAREMITDGENGLLTPVGDVDKLSEAMIRMISEDGLAEKCGNNAAKIRETHSVEKIAERWLQVIESVSKK